VANSQPFQNFPEKT